MKFRLAIFFLLLGSAPALSQQTATASFTNAAGDKNGTATLTQTPKGVLIELEVTGLESGKWVAFHIHETGTCDAKAHYDSAGGHFNPDGAEHGYFAPTGPHAGDMPNQQVGSDGTLRVQVFNPMVTLDGGQNAVRERALMIHAGPDDYKGQPAGNAGSRQACAVIE